MKPKEVMETLRISRVTLNILRKSGILKATKLPNGHNEYDEERLPNYGV